MRAYWYVEVLYRSARRFIGPFTDLNQVTEYQGAARRAVFGQHAGITVGPIRAVSLKGEEFPGMLDMAAGIPAIPSVSALMTLFTGEGDATQGNLDAGGTDSADGGNLGTE